MFTLGEIIDLAVRIEMNGRKAYRKAQEQVTDPALASMLGWLADEEAEHEKWFLRLKENLKIELEDPELEEMGKALLQGVLGDHTFSIDEADFSKIEDIESLLTLSVEFEKDTILFFEMLGAFIEDEQALNHLSLIIEEENRHVRFLHDFLTDKHALPIYKESV
ncbi:MAG: ferritin family protein [Deltaproteobacteria bacterium]|nr:ferritin family protein [Deltaproteobacteria bacterium]